MFISDIDKNKKRLILECINCLLISVLLIIFNAIYTHFSYGEYSLHMRYMFIFPLVFGSGASAVLLVLKKSHTVNRISFNLWNASVATYVFGCTVQGIINISGRHTEYAKVFFFIGIPMMLAAVAINILQCKRLKNVD